MEVNDGMMKGEVDRGSCLEYSYRYEQPINIRVPIKSKVHTKEFAITMSHYSSL